MNQDKLGNHLSQRQSLNMTGIITNSSCYQQCASTRDKTKSRGRMNRLKMTQPEYVIRQDTDVSAERQLELRTNENGTTILDPPQLRSAGHRKNKFSLDTQFKINQSIDVTNVPGGSTDIKQLNLVSSKTSFLDIMNTPMAISPKKASPNHQQNFKSNIYQTQSQQKQRTHSQSYRFFFQNQQKIQSAVDINAIGKQQSAVMNHEQLKDLYKAYLNKVKRQARVSVSRKNQIRESISKFKSYRSSKASLINNQVDQINLNVYSRNFEQVNQKKKTNTQLYQHRPNPNVIKFNPSRISIADQDSQILMPNQQDINQKVLNVRSRQSIVSINDDEFHNRQRILQDICSETKSQSKVDMQSMLDHFKKQNVLNFYPQAKRSLMNSSEQQSFQISNRSSRKQSRNSSTAKSLKQSSVHRPIIGSLMNSNSGQLKRACETTFKNNLHQHHVSDEVRFTSQDCSEDEDEDNCTRYSQEIVQNYIMSKPFKNRARIHISPQLRMQFDNDSSINREFDSLNNSMKNHLSKWSNKFNKSKRDVEWFEIMPLQKVNIPKQITPLVDKQNTRSLKFDPILYISKRTILCQKLHYAVPQTFEDIPALIKYDNEANVIKIFNIQSSQPKDNEDDLSDSNQQNNLNELINLDQQIDIKNILGFIYGSFTSRFWMMRIGLNQLIMENSERARRVQNKRLKQQKKDEQCKNRVLQEQSNDIQNKLDGSNRQHSLSLHTDSDDQSSCQEGDDENLKIPFYAWECISISMKDGHDVNLIIKDERQMQIFIQFLILKLKSFDGMRDTFQNVINAKRKNSRKTDQQIMQRVYNRYLLMKVQMKISFEATRQLKTIQELFLSSILKTYNQRSQYDLILNPYPRLSKKQIQDMKYLCLKSLTQQNILIKEANEMRKQDLINKGKENNKGIGDIDTKQNDQDKDDGKFKISKLQFELPSSNNELQNIMKAVNKKSYVDELFQETDQDNKDFQIVEPHVVQVKDEKTGMMRYKSSKDNLDDKNKKLIRLKAQYMFRNKMQKIEKDGMYHKLNLLVKLRLLEGPLFIYALLEIINLIKQIFVLQLEKGAEVAIPAHLRQDKLPLSYQFYNSLFGVIRQNVSQDSKSYLLKTSQKHKKTFFKKSLKEAFSDKDIKLSDTERIKRFLMYLKNAFQDRNKDQYHHKLKLYQHARENQTGKYAQISRDEFRIQHTGLGQTDKMRKILGSEFYSCPSKASHGNHESEENPKQFAIHEMTHGKIASLNGLEDLSDEILQNPNSQIVSKFLSSVEVGKQRKNLFKKKLFYQNQLTSLKEKGKRLILCEKIDNEIDVKKEEFFSETEKLKEVPKIRQISFEEQKEAIERLEEAYRKFLSQSLTHQESNIINLRRYLVKGLDRAKSFDAKTQFINNKIEYDQRFFNHGYSEQQKLVSDIRKQIRLNKEILRLKRKVNGVCDKIECMSQEINQDSQSNKALSQSPSLQNNITQRIQQIMQKSHQPQLQPNIFQSLKFPVKQQNKDDQIQQIKQKLHSSLKVQTKNEPVISKQDDQSDDTSDMQMQIWQKIAEKLAQIDPNKKQIHALTKKIKRRKENIKKIHKDRINTVQRDKLEQTT